MNTPNPSGLCQCGCGRKTRIAPRNQRSRGYVRGEPLRFCRGHQLTEMRKTAHAGSAPQYMPTPQQITAGCRDVQATWAPDVEASRRGDRVSHWTPPMIRMTPATAAELDVVRIGRRRI